MTVIWHYLERGEGKEKARGRQIAYPISREAGEPFIAQGIRES